MKKINFRILLITLSFLLIVPQIFSQEIPERPIPPRLVNDFTGTLNREQANQLERKLVQFNNQTSNQITVVLVNSLNGIALSDFAYTIGEKWKVGQKEFDNGIVIIIKPKIGREKGRAFIATGYGLEGAIPDGTTKLIVENEMIPFFKKGDYYGGINRAISIIIPLAAGEFSSDEYAKTTTQGGSPIGRIVPFLVLIIIFVLMRGSRARSHSVGAGIPFWTALLLGSMMGGSSHGSWNNFSSGSGGFGGGGGFGGFGGGSFGGGGAGGSW